MLQKEAPKGAVSKRERVDPIGDSDLIGANLHVFDQSPNDFSAGGPVRALQSVLNLFGKVIELSDDEPDLFFFRFSTLDFRGLVFKPVEPLSRLVNPRQEFRFRQDSFFVGIDESADPPTGTLDLSLQLVAVILLPMWLGQPPFVFMSDGFGIAEQRADVGPHSRVQAVGPHLLVVADAMPAKAISVASDATVVGVRNFSLGRGAADRFAVVGIAAAVAYDQTLKEMLCATLALAVPFLVLHKLFTNRLEQFLADQRWNGNRDALLERRVVDRIRSTRRLGLIALGTKSNAALADARFPEGRCSFVSGIFENSPYRRSIPPRLAARARNLLVFQPPAHLSERYSVPADPLEDLSHDLGVFEHDLVKGFAPGVPFRHIPVSIGGAAEHADESPACRVAFSATASLKDLRPFVLGDHALHLQEQVFFRTVADGPIQKDQFDATPPQLLDKQNLVGVLPGQAIRRMHVQAVKGARIGRVAQSFQRGTRSDAPL